MQIAIVGLARSGKTTVFNTLTKGDAATGGFGGLTAAKALGRAAADVLLIDKRNHHIFQPLLYQVATATLSPADTRATARLRCRVNQRVVVATIGV